MCFRNRYHSLIDGILPKGPYPPCLRMADRALLAGYPRLFCLVPLHDIYLYIISWSLLTPHTHFTNNLWACTLNLVEIHVTLPEKILTQPGHNFVHATTVALSCVELKPCLTMGIKIPTKIISCDFNCELMNRLWNGPSLCMVGFSISRP